MGSSSEARPARDLVTSLRCRTKIVDSDGNITVPYAGTIRAAGRTPLEVQQAIIEALTRR
jgi:protein involved in polysaccharide export with SLBB domain